jgi:uncharacterized protein
MRVGGSVIISEMTKEACEDFLSSKNFGHLACLNGDRPYVLPIHYVFKGGLVYSFAMPGSKIDHMRVNPNVCLQLEEITSDQDWLSVVLQGRYQELPDTEQWRTERMYAWSALQQRPNWWEPGAYDARRHEIGDQPSHPVFYRIQAESISGKRAEPN